VHQDDLYVHNLLAAAIALLLYPCPAAVPLQDEMERSTREGGPPMPLTIVFVERKNRCDEVAQALAAEGVPAAALHGGLSQVRIGWHGKGHSSCGSCCLS
jgi:superfamily II DNA/RNA helicase